MSEPRMVRLQKGRGNAILSICRPAALNALSREIVDQLDALLEEVRADQTIKALMIKSEGNFAAGADIEQMAACTPEQARHFAFSDTYQKLAELPIPTLAAMEGYALGGGLELALACDLRLASENAKMGFPEIGLGIMPGAGGTVRLARLVGVAKAKEMIFMGRAIDARKAQEIGLVNQVVPQEEFEEQSDKWLRRLTAQPRLALAAAKAAIDQEISLSIPDGLDRELQLWTQLFTSYDQKEGMKAFLEKRKPKFEDR